MKEVTEYRAGQRVRIEIEGVLRSAEDLGGSADIGGLFFQSDDGWPSPFLYQEGDMGGIARGGTVTVLAEPRPEEPTGLGAVVEAHYADNARQRWVSNNIRTDGAPRNRWTSIPYWGFLDWDLLVDPVVLHEGWTQ